MFSYNTNRLSCFKLEMCFATMDLPDVGTYMDRHIDA